jgi:pimeloyl-ACP methyl ester carboxylesterase
MRSLICLIERSGCRVPSLRTWLRHLGIPRAHVSGHSYGAAIAIQWALDAAAIAIQWALDGTRNDWPKSICIFSACF